MFEEHLVCFTYSIVILYILSYTWIETKFWFFSLSYPDNPHILFSDFFNLSWYSDNLFTQCIKLPDRQSLLKPPTSLSRKILYENLMVKTDLLMRDMIDLFMRKEMSDVIVTKMDLLGKEAPSEQWIWTNMKSIYLVKKEIWSNPKESAVKLYSLKAF